MRMSYLIMNCTFWFFKRKIGTTLTTYFEFLRLNFWFDFSFKIGAEIQNTWVGKDV